MSTSRFAQIDLSRLPAPQVIEPLDYDTIRSELIDDLSVEAPEVADMLTLESEPLVKTLEIVAYRELTLRARVNDAAKACMLAFASGTNLDHIAALFGVGRLIITEADPDAVPPIDAVFEGDTEFRLRTQLALEGFSTAGPEGAYIFHAMSADGQVKSVSVTSPNPGEVVVTVLGEHGAPDQALLDLVAAKLEPIRPLGDALTVRAATMVAFDIWASLTLFPGPDPDLVVSTAEDRLNDYLDRQQKVGADVTRAGIIGALVVEGVQNVNLVSPVADVEIDALSAANCTGVAIAFGGVDV